MDSEARHILELHQAQFDKLILLIESMSEKIIDLSKRVSSLEQGEYNAT